MSGAGSAALRPGGSRSGWANGSPGTSTDSKSSPTCSMSRRQRPHGAARAMRRRPGSGRGGHVEVMPADKAQRLACDPRSPAQREEPTARVEEEHQQIIDLWPTSNGCLPAIRNARTRWSRRSRWSGRTSQTRRAAESLRPCAGRARSHALGPGRRRGIRPVMPRRRQPLHDASARSAAESGVTPRLGRLVTVHPAQRSVTRPRRRFRPRVRRSVPPPNLKSASRTQCSVDRAESEEVAEPAMWRKAGSTRETLRLHGTTLPTTGYPAAAATVGGPGPP